MPSGSGAWRESHACSLGTPCRGRFIQGGYEHGADENGGIAFDLSYRVLSDNLDISGKPFRGRSSSLTAGNGFLRGLARRSTEYSRCECKQCQGNQTCWKYLHNHCLLMSSMVALMESEPFRNWTPESI